MTDQAAVTSINCRQCAAPLTVEQAQPFVTCRFCGATNFVDKERAVFHYLVRPTVREDGARAALNRWMAGQRYRERPRPQSPGRYRVVSVFSHVAGARGSGA